MQQPRPMLSPIPTQFPVTNITTEQIQGYLDENKKLILAILENQNLGKLAECAQFQAKLQHNLMYLAAIADAQPPGPPVHPQMPPPTVIQQGGHFMQHPQVGPQTPIFAQKVPMQFTAQQMQEQQLHRQHPSVIQAHMGMRSGPSNGVHVMHAEAALGGSSAGMTDFQHGGGATSSLDSRGNKNEGGPVQEGGTGEAGHGSVAAPAGVEGDASYMKGSEEGAN